MAFVTGIDWCLQIVRQIETFQRNILFVRSSKISHHRVVLKAQISYHGHFLVISTDRYFCLFPFHFSIVVFSFHMFMFLLVEIKKMKI